MFKISNISPDKLAVLIFVRKPQVEELRGRKDVPAISNKIYFLLLFCLQCSCIAIFSKFLMKIIN